MGLLSKIFRKSKPKVSNDNENKLIVYDGKFDIKKYPDRNSLESIAFQIHSDFKHSYGHLFTPGKKPDIVLSGEGGFNLVYMLSATMKEATEASNALARLCSPYDVSWSII